MLKFEAEQVMSYLCDSYILMAIMGHYIQHIHVDTFYNYPPFTDQLFSSDDWVRFHWGCRSIDYEPMVMDLQYNQSLFTKR